MYNFYGLQLRVRQQTKNVLDYLKTIIDNVEIERYAEKDTDTTMAYKITIMKNKFSKTFYFNIFDYDRVILQSMEINNYTISNYNMIEAALLALEDEIFISKNPNIKDIMNTIRCESNKCPICESQLNKNFNDIVNINFSLICPNKCYIVNTLEKLENENNLLTRTAFFNEMVIDTRETTRTVRLEDTEHLKLQFEQRIERINNIHKRIIYWKKDDKYLTKILGGL